MRYRLLTFFLQQGVEIGERLVAGGRIRRAIRPLLPRGLSQGPGVLVVVAIKAQQLPVAAVGRVVIVVVVPVMHRQFTEILPGKFACAAPADPREHLQRPRSKVVDAPIVLAPGLDHCPIQFIDVWRSLRGRHTK